MDSVVVFSHNMFYVFSADHPLNIDQDEDPALIPKARAIPKVTKIHTNPKDLPDLTLVEVVLQSLRLVHQSQGKPFPSTYP